MEKENFQQQDLVTLAKQYDPVSTEQKWIDYWEENGYFHSEPDDREPFTIVIPPPNVTGVLHMGHMLNNTIQDVLVRRARMLGKNACWVPGTDHASIATEAKVVQKLRKEGIRKSDLSREEFMKHAWAWTDEHGGIILEQLKKLGASCDWQRTRFTLEDDLYDAVIDCFIDLYGKGYIYRGLRMIHWDPEARTALSDEEVIHKEVTSKLYHVNYRLKDSDDTITIATTRPETILADTGVCVNPKDVRYKHLIGKTVLIPMLEREVPVIADSYVDPEFGTGCLKVTPAHDVNDYDIGQRHGLEVVDMFNEDGTVSEAGIHYIGKDRFEVRKLIVKDLEEAGQLVKVEDITNKVGYSERTDAVIEPRLSLQWFCRMDKLAKPALDNVQNGNIRFHPDKFKNSYTHWLENIRDWCISRQLWWGQRIPAWYYGPGDDDYVIAKTAGEALEKARIKAQKNEQQKAREQTEGDTEDKKHEKTPETSVHEKPNSELTVSDLRQDEDVLDTWFSSWLWPMTVFDGFKDPDNKNISYYYPTNDLVTAPEIMFFWVARMIMSGYEFRGEKPFSNVYFHGIVRDKQRRKMSKSLGNSPDPLKLIGQFGADGTRVGMLFSSPAGNDLLFDEALCEQGRNFANKIWNAFRFLSMNMEEGVPSSPSLEIDTDNLADRWMLSRVDQSIRAMEESFERYRLNEALQHIYSLVWDDFCDWYIELAKADQPGEKIPADRLNLALGFFEVLMKLLHPFMPFITEEIWQQIQERMPEEALTVSEWPVADGLAAAEDVRSAESSGRPAENAAETETKATSDKAAGSTTRVTDDPVKLFATIQQLVSSIRNIRAEMGLSPKTPMTIVIKPGKADLAGPLTGAEWILRKLLSVEKLTIDENAGRPKASASAVVEGCEIYIPLEGLIDLEKERGRIRKEIENTEGFLKSVEKKLSNKQFVENAPDAVVEKERDKLADARSTLEKLRAQLRDLG